MTAVVDIKFLMTRHLLTILGFFNDIILVTSSGDNVCNVSVRYHDHPPHLSLFPYHSLLHSTPHHLPTQVLRVHQVAWQ